MPTLQLEFNCLCLFVRDEPRKILHVLMPSTQGHQHAHPAAPPGTPGVRAAEGIEEHLVRLVHEAFEDEAPQGRPLEGWSLALGPASGTAELETLNRPAKGPQIVDVSELTVDARRKQGRRVQRGLASRSDARIASRFTLRAGRVVEVDADAEWTFEGRTVQMAYRVVWEIDDVPDVLPWKPLVPRDGSPLKALSELGAPVTLPVTGKQGYRLRVFNTTAAGLPPNDDKPGQLSQAEVTHHFGIFYEVLGLPTPSDDLLPQPTEDDSVTVNCGTGQAVLQPA